MKITLESADIQELEALEVELEEMVQAAKNLRYVPIGIHGESDDKVKLASVKSFICQKVLPPLKFVKKWVCKLKFIPGVKGVCQILKDIVDGLEEFC